MKIVIGKPSLPPVTISEITGDLLLHYAGTKGSSVRRISLNALKGEEKADGTINITTINAYCHERKMARSFKMDSVISMAEPETGVIVTDLLAWLKARQ